MAFSKADKYCEQLQMLSHYSKALIHPERPMILEYLLEEGPLTVIDLTKRSPLSQTAISQHLENLRTKDLVGFHESFPFTHYNVKVANVVRMREVLNSFLGKFGE
jgi:DNA-binding transcriptional ArsR family regulator